MSIPFTPISPRSTSNPFHQYDLIRSIQATSPTPTPSPPRRKSPTDFCLLVPAVRWTDELEEAWRDQLGNFEVVEEVRLKGYQLHGVKDWLMQSERLVRTVVNFTGVDSHNVTAFRLAPAVDVTDEQARLGLSRTITMLSEISHAKSKSTEFGCIMVTSLSGFSLSTFAITSGDLREAMPTIIVNTDLRRLGCSGRAELRLDAPSDAFRRKFSEMYHMACPSPQHGTPLSRSTSPSSSPLKHRHTQSLGSSPITLRPDNVDPFPIAVIELGKLIQSALALFGCLKPEKRFDPDGLLCDAVMRAFERWLEYNQLSGLGNEFRTSERRSDEIITPPLVALLLSSVTAVRYKLASVGAGQAEKIPKDPFTDISRFQNSWRGWQLSGGKNHRVESLFITPSLQARLDSSYSRSQSRNPDRYKNPINKIRSQVAHATSALSLKASAEDQSSSRHRDPSRRMTYDSAGDSEGEAGYTNRHDGPSGFALEYPTDDLELYVRNITKLRQKDLEAAGGVRIARLWTGKVCSTDIELFDGQRRDRRLDPLRRRMESPHVSDRDLKGLQDRHLEGEESKRGSLRSTMSKTQLAIGNFGRSRPVGDTSDSDVATPPSATQNRMSAALKIPTRKGTNHIPSVIEPDVEDVDDGLSLTVGWHSTNGTSPPGPSSYESRLHVPPDLSATRSSRTGSTRPSINTAVSYSGSDTTSFAAYGGGSRRGSRVYEAQVSTVDESATPSFVNMPLSTSAKMMRTASDGAEVTSEGVEFTVKQPRGALVHTLHGHDVADEIGARRRHSLADRLAYVDMPRDHPDHMLVDVEVCTVVWQLRRKELEMLQQIKHIETLEKQIESALDVVHTEMLARHARVNALRAQGETIISELPDPQAEPIDSLREVTRLEEELAWNVDNISNIFRSHQRKELDRLLLHLDRKTLKGVCTVEDKDEEGETHAQEAAVASRWWHSLRWW